MRLELTLLGYKSSCFSYEKEEGLYQFKTRLPSLKGQITLKITVNQAICGKRGSVILKTQKCFYVNRNLK